MKIVTMLSLVALFSVGCASMKKSCCSDSCAKDQKTADCCKDKKCGDSCPKKNS
jgi:PBP1b-binding outer membrane lipoprotein LpoB